MKQFEYPVCELIQLSNVDVIRTSEAGQLPGTCLEPQDE